MSDPVDIVRENKDKRVCMHSVSLDDSFIYHDA